MYGTSPYFNQQAYQQDLINMRDRLDKQIQQAQMTPQHQPTAINQTFQLSSTQNSSGIKFAKDIDEVKKELVFTDTLFVNKEYTLLWYKNANITSAAAGPLVLAIKSNGEQVAGTEMDTTVVTANTFANVSASTIIKVPFGASKTISIGNQGTLATLVKNANIIIQKVN